MTLDQQGASVLRSRLPLHAADNELFSWAKASNVAGQNCRSIPYGTLARPPDTSPGKLHHQVPQRYCCTAVHRDNSLVGNGRPRS